MSDPPWNMCSDDDGGDQVTIEELEYGAPSGDRPAVAAATTAPRRRTSTPSSRVLGGMMLSKDAIADVVEALRGTDFYRPAHEVVYDAILDLYGRGEPADADHRRRRADQARRDQRGSAARPTCTPSSRRCPPPRTPATTRGSCASGPCCAGWSRPAPASSSSATAPTAATSTTSSTRAQAEVYAVTERRIVRGLPDPRRHHRRRRRRDRGRRPPRRGHDRRADGVLATWTG